MVDATTRGFCGHDPLSALLWEQGMAVSTLARAIGRRSQTANDWLPEWLPPDLSALMQLLVVDEDEFLNLTEDCEALVAERMAA